MRRLAAVLVCIGMSTAPLMAQYRPGPPPNGSGQDPWSYSNGNPGNWDRSWNNRPSPRSGACFFTEKNFQGNRFCVRSGDRLGRLPGNIGDNISSVQVYGRGGVQVFEDRDFRGVSQRLRGSIPDLQRLPSKPGHTWNNRISSVAVN